jgi:hypothetical protein
MPSPEQPTLDTAETQILHGADVVVVYRRLEGSTGTGASTTLALDPETRHPSEGERMSTLHFKATTTSLKAPGCLGNACTTTRPIPTASC